MFSSAFEYLNNFSSQQKGVVLNGIIEINSVKLRIKKLIAEGKYRCIENVFFVYCSLNSFFVAFSLYRTLCWKIF